jgi:predicted nucleic acid-binding protein
VILLDTNTIIYLRNSQLDEKIVGVLRDSALNTCNIIVAEVLGYKAIDQEDAVFFRDFLVSMKNHSFDEEVTEKVIELRKTTNIKLPNAIIAATALVNNLVHWTHNTTDFTDIPGLQTFDPLQN